MLKNYELLYVVHPDLEGSTEKVTEKVANFITKAEGKVESQEDWGKRKLAYSIARNDFGVYILVHFEAESTKLSELERNLRLSEEVMRSMVVALPEEKAAPAPKKEKTAKAEKVEPVAEVKEEKEEAETKAEALKEKKPAVKKEKAEKTVKEAKAEEKPKTTAKEEKAKEENEKDRLKKLDEKLEELLGEDKK